MGDREGALEALEVNSGFWKGRRVLLTGHTGFKGGWLALWLHRLGAKVSGFALAPATRPSLFDAARIGRAVDHEVGDIRDLAVLRRAMEKARPDVVLHLAAQALVRQSYAEPVATYATNVLGTVHLLEAARRAPSARAVVVVTSDKCYDNRERTEGYRESEPMGGRDPYSSSKGCAELVTAAYRTSFLESSGIAVASARAGNVIGGGDWSADRLLADVYRAAAAGLPVQIRNPKAVRPWQHVLEPLAGYLILAERLYSEGRRFAEAWNFGPGDADARPVGEVMDQVVRLWGEGLHWERDTGSHPHEAQLLRLDSTKARGALGWRPRMGLDEALRWTVEWYKAELRGEDMQRRSFEQIERYAQTEKV